MLRICRRNFDEKLRGEEKLGAELFQQKTEITDRDRQLSDAKATMDKYLRDYDALFARTQKVGTPQILFILYCYEIFVVWCGVVWYLLQPQSLSGVWRNIKFCAIMMHDFCVISTPN